jgi:hypothetical protein
MNEPLSLEELAKPNFGLPIYDESTELLTTERMKELRKLFKKWCGKDLSTKGIQSGREV